MKTKQIIENFILFKMLDFKKIKIEQTLDEKMILISVKLFQKKIKKMRKESNMT